VVEIEPELKHGLYAELARNGLTLKDWLIGRAERYIKERQPSSPVRRSPTAPRKQPQ
jgi:hypothetical protein